VTAHWPRRITALVAGCTFLLIIAGGLVTSTGSGLAVPDWPLSFGQLFPRMEGGVLYEHGHRLVAASVGLLTIVMAIVLQRTESRAWVRRLGWIALGAVILQGLLGGLTVLLRLPDATSIAHAGLAEVFFAITVTLAVVTARSWRTHPEPGADAAAVGTRRLALAVAVTVYVQILLGAVVRHTGAGLAIPDFPLAYGRLIPPFYTPGVKWQFAHRVGAVACVALVAWLTTRVLRRHRAHPFLTRPALVLAAVAAVQVLLGGLTIWHRKAPTPTTAHVATGALLWVTAVALALRAHRALRPGGERP